METKLTFKEAYELPIGEYVEKKGKFSYLSWPFAVRYLREHFPEAQWIVHENPIGQPLFDVNGSFMVKVSVIVDGIEFPQWLPVLDYKNNPISEPNAFQVNTSIQRCLVKAIGLATGIGLALYAGEDLPKEEEQEKQYKESKLPEWIERFDSLDLAADRRMMYLDNEKQILKDLSKQEVSKLQSYLKQLKDAEGVA